MTEAEEKENRRRGIVISLTCNFVDAASALRNNKDKLKIAFNMSLESINKHNPTKRELKIVDKLHKYFMEGKEPTGDNEVLNYIKWADANHRVMARRRKRCECE